MITNNNRVMKKVSSIRIQDDYKKQDDCYDTGRISDNKCIDNKDYDIDDKSVINDHNDHYYVDNRLKVLEIGAINIQLHKYKQYLNIRSIDLHSQHPLIEECDFFTIEPKQCYDVVVCSMVII